MSIKYKMQFNFIFLTANFELDWRLWTQFSTENGWTAAINMQFLYNSTFNIQFKANWINQWWNIDPRGRPTVTAGSDHCFRTCRPCVRPHFSQNETNLLARLWVWPSGSLMTPVLYVLFFHERNFFYIRGLSKLIDFEYLQEKFFFAIYKFMWAIW